MFNGNSQHENNAYRLTVIKNRNYIRGMSMSMDAYMRSNAVDTAKGIIVSGFLVCTLALASGGGATQSTSMYDTGKKIFLERVVCDTCPYASLELNTEKVHTVWPDLQLDLKKAGVIGQELSWWQRISAEHYIKNRFSL